MRFSDEEIHTAASTGDPPPHTEPPDLGTHHTVNTPNETAVNPHTQPDPEVHFLTDARNGFGSSAAWQCSGKYGTDGLQAHASPISYTAMSAA
jgi:hypothetical protein